MPPSQDTNVDPPQVGERRINVRKEAQLPSLVLGYHVPNLRHADSYVLEVIAAMLAQGESSRLFHSLVREKRLVLHIEADHALLSRAPGLFTVAATLLPGKEAAEVERALDQEIARLQHETIDERELEKAKNQLQAAFVFGQDSAFYQAALAGGRRQRRNGTWPMPTV
jgi:zinc protease